LSRGARHVALAGASIAIALGVLVALELWAVHTEPAPEPQPADEPEAAVSPPAPLEVSFELAPAPTPTSPPPAPAPAEPAASQGPVASLAATSQPAIPRGAFSYDDRLAEEGLPLLDDEPVVIRAHYGAIGYESYVAAMRALGGRGFVVSGRARPELHLEIDPSTGAILSSEVSSRDVAGLAMNLPREIGHEAERRWRGHRSARDVLDDRATSVVLVLPARVEAYFRAALKRAVTRSGARFDDISSFRGRYERHRSDVRLRLVEARRTDGGRMTTDIILDLAPRS
jgi:hypothetical protein